MTISFNHYPSGRDIEHRTESAIRFETLAKQRVPFRSAELCPGLKAVEERMKAGISYFSREEVRVLDSLIVNPTRLRVALAGTTSEARFHKSMLEIRRINENENELHIFEYRLPLPESDSERNGLSFYLNGIHPDSETLLKLVEYFNQANPR